jgi:predicted ATPase
MAIKGFGASEVERAFFRARELCRQVGDTPQLFLVLRGLAAFYLVRADYKITQELGEQSLRLAQHLQEPLLLVGAHLERGGTLFSLGEFVQALKHLEQGIALYDPQKYRSHAFLHGQDLGVSCLSRATSVLWMLGYPDQALKKSQEAIALAQEVSHPQSLAYALSFAAECHRLRREGQAAHERAEAALALSTEQGFAIWAAGATILRGWALAEQGQVEEGSAQMCQGLAAWQATGAEMGRPQFLGTLAETYGKGGQVEEGLSVLAEALAIVNTTRESFYEAELYRLKGELTLAQGSIQGLVSSLEKEVEECFWKAFEIARWQQAKSWELRAVMSLGRLWLRQGKRAEARRMLTEIYGWFTEGFDTGDLKEAKALLEDLS